ncbi:hypothetical protein ACDF64_12040 [Agromyces sp. MMS24-JH15]|uniref:hypothetical protein n=1 Tax=Agromyces sp. MMS24-JH15 TaxID=3243765 RepID=UPI0037483BAC
MPAALPPEPTPAEYLEHRRSAHIAGTAPSLIAMLGPAFGSAALAAVGVFAFALLGGTLIGFLGADPNPFFTFALVAAILTFPGVLVFSAVATRRRLLDRRLRIDRFAASQGYAYAEGGTVRFPGIVFAQGGGRTVTEHVRSVAGREVEAGNYRYTTGNGKSETTHFWSYVAIRLDAPLPHMVLDATSNDTWGSSLPTAIGRAQRLELEGDFDRSFRLYVPDGYERDALYVFTPDLMALLIDHAAQDDLEIVDDWMLCYRQGTADLADRRWWAQLGALTSTVADRLADRGERYRDERVAENLRAAEAHFAGVDAPAPRIATGGRRLRTRLPLPTLLGGIGFVALAAWFWLSDMFGW